MGTSNAEKQGRFRKKEELKRRAESVYRLRIMSIKNTKSPQELRFAIDKAIDLPNGWTDQDYQQAEWNLHQIEMEYFDNPHLLENDVYEGRNSRNEFMTSPDPAKLVTEEKAALADTRALAAHLISALELSKCNDSDKAAALMEALRFAGRSLLNSREVPRSNATARCLAVVGKQYTRPEWFAETLTNALAWQIDEANVSDVGKRLSEFDYNIKL
jgi:hypothetical protein